MAHTPEIIDWKSLSNGQVAVLCRCCGDPATDSWHTMASTIPQQDIDASIEKHKEDVAAQHAATQSTEAFLLSKVGKAAIKG